MVENERYILLSQHFTEIKLDEMHLDIVGQKAIGLLFCLNYFTTPFFVLKTNLYKLWLKDNLKAEQILKSVIEYITSICQNNNIESFIIRSSAKIETFEERGFYKSSTGGIKLINLCTSIVDMWKQNLPNFNKYESNEFATIIQQYIKPKLSGHLSNERRISKNTNNWLVEVVNQKNEFVKSTKFVAKKSKEQINESSLNCNNKDDIIKVLKKIATLISLKDERTHIEWIWDGIKLWIVQNDLEELETKGEKPGSEWKQSANILDKKTLKCFSTVANTTKNWKKSKCIKTFIDCKLPFGEVYILENPDIIKQLLENQIENSLKDDLGWLLSYPIVIRMDIQNADGYNNILLPRTETLFTVLEAVDFLKLHVKSFFNQGLTQHDFCFLIHRFIISKSCALAFSKPNIQKARIDSTWGIVDGLYYHPHDSFEVSLMNNNSQIKKQIRCKTEYLDVNNSGTWFSKKSGSDWDWLASLSKKQILEITKFNTTISDYLDSPVTVMYFVDVDTTTGYPAILPWFYTTEEIAASSEKFTDVIFSTNHELIQNEADYTLFKSRVEEQNLVKVTIKLKLNSDILRDKSFIEKIGDFAKNKNIPIELEGSVLSHTYYILKKMGVKVKCLDPFEPKYKRQKFYKLVRDKIPVNIELKGEKVRTVKIKPYHLLKFLKGKAIEEAYEFYWENEDDKIIEELADMYEVIRASCKIFNIKIDELEKIADKKNEKKGGFETGVVLVDTTESSLIDIVNVKGQSLLIENDSSSKESYQKIRTPKLQKIAIGIDNSITLPYIITGGGSGIKELNAPVNFEEIKSLKINYSNKGIKINFIKKEEQLTQKTQLDLFGPNE